MKNSNKPFKNPSKVNNPALILNDKHFPMNRKDPVLDPMTNQNSSPVGLHLIQMNRRAQYMHPYSVKNRNDFSNNFGLMSYDATTTAGAINTKMLEQFEMVQECQMKALKN